MSGSKKAEKILLPGPLDNPVIGLSRVQLVSKTKSVFAYKCARWQDFSMKNCTKTKIQTNTRLNFVANNPQSPVLNQLFVTSSKKLKEDKSFNFLEDVGSKSWEKSCYLDHLIIQLLDYQVVQLVSKNKICFCLQVCKVTGFFSMKKPYETKFKRTLVWILLQTILNHQF